MADPNDPNNPNLTGTQVAVGQLTANLKDAEATLERLNKQLAQAPKLIEEGRITLQDQTELYKEINRAEAQRISTQQSLIALGEENVTAATLLNREQIKLVVNAKAEAEERGDTLKLNDAILNVLSKQDLAYRAQLRGITALEAESQKVAGAIGLQRDYQNSSLKALIESSSTMEGFGKTAMMGYKILKSYINPAEVAYKLFTELVKTTVDFNKELYAANVSLNKATGQSAKFRDNLVEASRTAGVFGGSTDDVANAIGSMIENFSYFGTLTETQRGSILRMTNTLRGLGVESDTLANNLLYMNRNMNLSVDESIKLNESLATYAESIGMAPKKFLSEFATAMPKLEVYGNRGEEVFRQLAKQSQMAGIGIDELIGITSKMDTFEGAAEAASQLNSALGGGYFDATELLLADEAERLDIIKNTINAQGIQFDQLGKFEKKLLATAAGFEDVAKFERLLNGEGEKFGKQQQSLNDLLSDSIDIMGSLRTIFLRFAPDIANVVKPLKEFLAELATNDAVFDNFMSYLDGAVKFVGGLWLGMKALGKYMGIAADTAKFFGKGFLFVTKVLGKLFIPLNLVLSVFEAFSAMSNSLKSGDSFGTAIMKGLGSGVLDFFGINLVAEAVTGEKPLNSYRNGTSYHPGGMAIVGDGPGGKNGELVSLPQGSRVASAPRTAGLMTNQEGLMRELINKVDNLGKGGAQTINLVVDGKVLASTVFKNSSYTSIG